MGIMEYGGFDNIGTDMGEWSSLLDFSESTQACAACLWPRRGRRRWWNGVRYGVVSDPSSFSIGCRCSNPTRLDNAELGCLSRRSMVDKTCFAARMARLPAVSLIWSVALALYIIVTGGLPLPTLEGPGLSVQQVVGSHAVRMVVGTKSRTMQVYSLSMM